MYKQCWWGLYLFVNVCRCVDTVEELSIFEVLAELLDDSFDALIELSALEVPSLSDSGQFPADVMAEVPESRFVVMSIVVVPVVCLSNRGKQ